ncbi:hypothetical protein KIPB_004782 [Kipferlia bialata]|uniref:Uncharacterized protein n=1 Tax=Kipferlia bialata TaxID=797122 RepID=A0A391NLG3_9EUKA|nr:hypothetical protein KIPB_004782 [Kipferlia bialata]|eukprot:g4782.t1
MPAEFVYTPVDLGHTSNNHPGLVYTGASSDGVTPSDTLQEGETRSVLIVGQNSVTPSTFCVLVTQDPLTSLLSCTPIPCPIPGDTKYCTADRVGDTVYVFGGQTGLSCSDSLYAYSIPTRKWRQVVQRGGHWPPARHAHASFTLGGRLYVAGGMVFSNSQSSYYTGLNSLRDCWCYDPATDEWARQGDAPLCFYLSTAAVVGGTVHLMGDSGQGRMHLSYRPQGGWVTEEALPFKAQGAAAVTIGPRVYVMTGKGVYVYHPRTRVWMQSDDLPVTLGYGRACLLGPHTPLVYSASEAVVGCMGEGHVEQLEREQREERERATKARAALQTLGAPAEFLDTLHPSTLCILPYIVAKITQLEAEIETRAKRETDKGLDPIPLCDLGAIDTLIDRVQGTDASALAVHIDRLSQYAPVAQALTRQQSALQEFLSAHPKDQLLLEGCSGLQSTLEDLHSSFHASLQTLSDMDIDPSESLTMLLDATVTVAGIDNTHTIALPPTSDGLSLPQKRAYHRGETWNDRVRELFRLADPLLECTSALHTCMAQVGGMETPDLGVCQTVEEEGRDLLQQLYTLAPKQTQALALLREYQGMTPIPEVDVMDVEYDISCIQNKLDKQRHRLTHADKLGLKEEMTTLQQRVCDMRECQACHQRLATELQEYSIFPEVAAALSVGVSGSGYAEPERVGTSGNGEGQGQGQGEGWDGEILRCQP